MVYFTSTSICYHFCLFSLYDHEFSSLLCPSLYRYLLLLGIEPRVVLMKRAFGALAWTARLLSHCNKYHKFATISLWQGIVSVKIRSLIFWGAPIAQWIRLRLPSCRPGFESQAHHLRFFQFILFKLYICHLNWNVKRTKINKNEAGIGPFFLKKEEA